MGTAPRFSNGWTLLGEVGKFFPLAGDRFSDLTFDKNGVNWHATFHGCCSENSTVALIAPGVLDAVSKSANKTIPTTNVRCSVGVEGWTFLQCNAAGCHCSRNLSLAFNT